MEEQIVQEKRKGSLLKLLVLLLILAVALTYLKNKGYLGFLEGQYQAVKIFFLSVKTTSDNSADASIKDKGDEIWVDFSSCTPDSKRFELNFGFSSIEVLEKNKNDDCVIKIGGDINNLDAIAKSKRLCYIPVSAGLISLPKNPDKVDFSSIGQFCK